MEFLKLVESIKAEEATVQKIFNSNDGRVASPSRISSPERYYDLLAEALELYTDVVTGKKRGHYLVEAMTTSDFPILFGDILDRQFLAEFQEWPSVWKEFTDVRSVRDFRPVEYRYTTASEQRLERVHEQEEYPEGSVPDIGKLTYAVAKWGRRLGISWESLVNDDIDYFANLPERFARAARRTEAREAIKLFVDAAGPISPFFSVANDNLLEGAGSALSITSLQTALSKFRNLKDEDDEPIVVEAAILIIPPALEVTAQNILNATEIHLDVDVFGEGEVSGASTGKVVTGNWLKNRVRPVVDPYISTINEANGDTAWYLFAAPSSGRPATQMAFLRGHEEPRVYIKEANARRAGGGPADPLEGDFDTDTVEYKIRHVLGGSRIEPKAAVAAEGA